MIEIASAQHTGFPTPSVSTKFTAQNYYPHMLGIYRLLFLCLSTGISVRDISGVDWQGVMKFGRIVDLGG